MIVAERPCFSGSFLMYRTCGSSPVLWSVRLFEYRMVRTNHCTHARWYLWPMTRVDDRGIWHGLYIYICMFIYINIYIHISLNKPCTVSCVTFMLLYAKKMCLCTEIYTRHITYRYFLHAIRNKKQTKNKNCVFKSVDLTTSTLVAGQKAAVKCARVRWNMRVQKQTWRVVSVRQLVACKIENSCQEINKDPSKNTRRKEF